MLRRPLGSSGLEISPIGLGSWAIGGSMWGGQDDAESTAAIHAAVDHGVNWIDTAPAYGSGHSETVVGLALKTLPASRRPLVFTKFGLDDNSDAPNKSATQEEVLAECGASLTRLGVERIDLYQPHWPVPPPMAETAAACERLLKAGKIRAIGVSNFSVAQLDEWRSTGVPLHSLQPPYSILRAPPPRLTCCRGARGTAWAPLPIRRCFAACCSARGAETRPSRPATGVRPIGTTRARAFSGICRPLTRSRRWPRRAA